MTKEDEAFIAGYTACYEDVEDYDYDMDERVYQCLKEWQKNGQT